MRLHNSHRKITSSFLDNWRRRDTIVVDAKARVCARVRVCAGQQQCNSNHPLFAHLYRVLDPALQKHVS